MAVIGAGILKVDQVAPASTLIIMAEPVMSLLPVTNSSRGSAGSTSSAPALPYWVAPSCCQVVPASWLT